MKQNQNFRKQLQGQTKEWLCERLSEFVQDDETNADRIYLYLAAQESEERDVIAAFKSVLDKTVKRIEDHGPFDWRRKMPRRGLYNIADALADVSLRDKQAAVFEIAEYALLKLDTVCGLQDECELDCLIDAFRHLHLSACYKIKPDPEQFGRHLAELANQTEWGFFDGPPTGYADLLGTQGLNCYAATLGRATIQD